MTGDGVGHDEFFEVSGVAQLGDGRIVVANAGSGELRFFDSEGRYQHTAGGKGSGPGEFRYISRMYVLEDDSLLVYDGMLQRISIYDRTGEFVRVIHPITDEGRVWPLSTIGVGRILLASVRPFGGEHATTGVYTDSTYAMVADLAGTIHDTIGRFPIYERYVRLDPGGYKSTIESPFGRETWMAGGGGRLFVTISDAYQIYVYDREGQLEQIFRIPIPLRAVTDTDIERYIESRKSERNERRRRVDAQLLPEMPFPETFPPFSRLVLSAEGYLWATEYRAPYESRTRWWIFDPNGQWLGRVNGPDRFRAHQIGRDYVLGVHVDELGVEHVRSYRLIRS